MADVITRFKLETTQFDSKLRDSAKSLSDLTGKLLIAGKDFDRFASKNVEAARALGSIQSGATNTKDKVRDLVGAFNDVTRAYNQLTKEQQQTDFGKAMAGSLNQLKGRITEAKQELYGLGDAMEKSTGEGLDLKSLLYSLGGELGINSQLMGLVTTGTIGYTAAITAAVAATVAATKAWADYNAELSKQTNAAMVTTGLKGEDLNKLVDSAKAVADIYGTDFREVVNAANTLMTQFGKNGDEAMQLIRDGMQGMIMGDGQKLLSMIQQYAPSFRDAGIEASQLVAIIQNSEGGIFTDHNMNAIVMGIRNIRLMTKQTSDSLAKLGIDGEDMSQKLSDGSMTIFEALQQVAGKIEDVGSGSQAAGEVMQTVFGRQGTMAGTKLGEAIATLNTNLAETKNQTGNVGQSMATLELATEKLNKSIRDCFGYDGWEVMANGIKSALVSALAEAITAADDLRTIIHDISGIDVFSSMISGALNSLGPLGQVVDKLRQMAGLGQIVGGGYISGIGQSMANTIRGAAGGVGGGGGTPTPTGDSAEVAALKKQIEDLTKALADANKPKGGGGGKSTPSWSPIAMGDMAGIDISTLGRSRADVKADLSAAQKEYETAGDVFGRMAANILIEQLKSELGTMEAQENPFADVNNYDFQKDIDRWEKEQKGEEDKDKENKDKKEVSLAKEIGNMAGGMDQVVGGLEQLGVDIPDGLKGVIGGIQTVSSILTGIMSIVMAIQAISAAEALIPFARGGIVGKAAGGMMIPGNSFSGDNLRLPVAGGGMIGVNAGELILNRAQQGNLAAQLSTPSGSAMGGQPYVSGENIYLGVNNYSRRSGRGELVTTEMLKNRGIW